MIPVYRPPDWLPLRRALVTVFGAPAMEAWAAFWFVGFAPGPVDVGDLRLYEHSTTKRLVALDARGAAYCWLAMVGGYVRMDDEEALIAALV